LATKNGSPFNRFKRNYRGENDKVAADMGQKVIKGVCLSWVIDSRWGGSSGATHAYRRVLYHQKWVSRHTLDESRLRLLLFGQGWRLIHY
jgi:hypothetical protein